MDLRCFERYDFIALFLYVGYVKIRFTLAISIAPLPDTSGFKTGTRGLRFYRRIAPLERKIEHFSLNDSPIDFQRLATGVILPHLIQIV